MLQGRALPKKVGALDLSSFGTGGCKHYVDNFEEYLLPLSEQVIGRVPRVMVSEVDWPEVCAGLVASGIYKVVPQSCLHHVGETPLLNRMFAVSKNEFTESGVELHRLIMNLVPVNRLCRSLKGDAGTLPTIAGLSAFYLEEDEVAVMSSEDIKCFYYLVRVPETLHKYLGSARPVPPELVPEMWQGEVCHLTAWSSPWASLMR